MAKGNHIIKMAVYKVKENRLKVVLPAVRKFVRTVNKEEKGDTLMYTAFQKKGNPQELVHLMVFKDRDAEKRHKKSPHAQKFVEVLYPNCSAEPVFIDLTKLK